MAGAHYTSSVVWHGDQISRGVARGGVIGTTKAAHRLQALSVPLAPIDTGALRESASVVPANDGQNLPEAALVFDTPYAAAQHENEQYHHDQGQAKYVEQPLTEHSAELQGIIAAEVRLGIIRG